MTSPVRWRLRLSYAKTGRLRYLAHLDLVRLFERACRQAGLPLAMSEGYSPAPRIAYGWPLPVGMAGLAEYVDVELVERVPPEKAAAELNRVLPEGLEIREGRYISPHGPSLMAEFDTGSYLAHLPDQGRPLAEWRKAAAALLAEPRLPVTRERGPAGGKVVDVRPLIRRLEVREGPPGTVAVFMELALGERGAGRPDEVAGLLAAELARGSPSPDGTGPETAPGASGTAPGASGTAPGAGEGAGGTGRAVARPAGLRVVRLGLKREGAWTH